MTEEQILIEQLMLSTRKKGNNAVQISCFVIGIIILGAASLWFSAVYKSNSLFAAVGGPNANSESESFINDKNEIKNSVFAMMEAEERINRLRTKKEVLSRREEILRYQLKKLDDERGVAVKKNVPLNEEYRRSRNMLVMLLKDQEDTDKQLVEFLRQMWESEGKMRVASIGMESGQRIVMSWPVDPTEGISAWFKDKSYEERFGIEHNAIDIPVVEMTEIKSAANGTVNVIADNGMGYNYIIIRHEGFATLYGHVREFLVEKGQEVKEGDVIALSGGIPGTPGAGALTTGAHLHFELITGNGHEDPIKYLPYKNGIN